MKKINLFIALTFFTIIFITGDLLAIPAFARKYGFSCKTCHSPFPSLKAYGDEFAGDGFQIKDQEAPRYYVETGDPDLSLIRDLPLAFRLEGYVTYNHNNTEKSDFNAPLVFKLLSGGAIATDIAYYVYYILENGEAGKLEDAWFMFNDLFSSDLDFIIGQFQVSDPLFKRELRLTRDDYLAYKVKPGHSNVNLTYDRGIMLMYGFESGTDIILEILNGNGIGEGFLDGNFDNDQYKNLFGRLSQNIGDNFRIGGLGYWGKEEQEINSGFSGINELWMIGGDATLSFDPLELNLQFIERQDDNPFFINNPEDVQTRAAFGELIYRPDGDESKWYSAALFNWIESDQQSLNTKSLSLHLGFLARTNIRLVTEFTYDFKNKNGTIGAGFISAF